MFDPLLDDKKPKKNPEDIFEGVETPASSSVSAPASVPPLPSHSPPEPQAPFLERRYPASKPPHRSLLKGLLLVLVGLAIIAMAAFIAYRFLTKPTQETIQAPVREEEESEEEAPTQEEEPPAPAPIDLPETDTDKDGLTDAQEQALGTSLTLTDTDDDGLFDREEIQVYKTDALNPDTDGDGFKDGEEVSNGYNPSGSGKLFDVPK